MQSLLRALAGKSALVIKSVDQKVVNVSYGVRSISGIASESSSITGKDSSIDSILASATDAQEPNAATLMHLHSATTGEDIVTVAGQCGARLTGQELRRLKDSFSALPYPKVPEKDLLYPPGVIEDTQMQVIRRHNISMPCKHNQRIYGTVYAKNEDRAWVDIGHSTLAIFKRSELMVSDLATPKDTKVEPRQHAHDIRVGDRFIFRIQELKCPLGSIWLEPHRRSKQDLEAAVWEELKRHHTTNEPVSGRILNDVNGGFAVGIAGVVAMLPWDAVRQHGAGRELCKRLGSLQPFIVSNMNVKYRECFLRFPRSQQRRRFDRQMM